MFDQPEHRQTVEYEADVERVLVEIEQDPYVEQFATAAFRTLRARKRALKADGE
jgi:prefoldin subunit 5